MSRPPESRSPFRSLPSAHASVAWPALPGPGPALTASLLQQLEESQWLAPEELRARQLLQAGALLDHAYRHLPFYRDRLALAGHLPGKVPTPEVWANIPVLSRADLQRAGAALFSPAVPERHGKTYELTTSGSTGRPITARGTAMTQLFYDVLTLREHLWHRRDFSGTLAAIRALPNDVAGYPEGARGDSWGRSMRGLFDTGPGVMLSVVARVEEQLDWLQRQQPDYLLIYPSALRDLLLLCKERGVALAKLREVRTLSEALPAATRELCREVWGLKVIDMYSTQEAGYLALQCPDHEHYHAQSESVLLEVIDEAGQPCAPGEVGQVVVTPLVNFAMPMIRYAVGDLAEVGEVCSCGRGLPVLKRVLGRVRDMLVYPDGRKAWALMGEFNYSQFPEVRQFQAIQHGVDDIELKIVADRRLTGIEEGKLIEWFRYRSQHDFPIRVTYHEEIPRGPGGKFQDFRCDVTEAQVRELRERKA
ncbi:hypothetical protein AAFN88_02365 [Pelagibius sp. CAU 1746]|uniref:phenylacetate--CoA ligase family protein n=1 Tax=Pelagibius sp. CAU 1746 TaxID=3140370 RepID=UPI00325BBDAC